MNLESLFSLENTFAERKTLHIKRNMKKKSREESGTSAPMVNLDVDKEAR